MYKYEFAVSNTEREKRTGSIWNGILDKYLEVRGRKRAVEKTEW